MQKQNKYERFTLTERAVVVAIILFVTAIAIGNLLQSVSESEERTLNEAAAEYATLRSMYAEHYQTAPASMTHANASGAVTTLRTPGTKEH
jgi:type II secretory pathway pseudopilin PulG